MSPMLTNVFPRDGFVSSGSSYPICGKSCFGNIPRFSCPFHIWKNGTSHFHESGSAMESGGYTKRKLIKPSFRTWSFKNNIFLIDKVMCVKKFGGGPVRCMSYTSNSKK